DVEVAVKLLTDAQGESQELSHARFKREAKAAAQLKSPHVTLIHDFGVDNGSPYMVMELLDGEDLASVLEREGKLAPTRAAEIMQQVCSGLAVAHEAGIIHRDLKPSNVFLARVGKHEVVKILDFGIAKELGARLVDSARTKSGVVVGSPRYMSPEQTQGAPIDTRSDLWSLGVMAFEMVTGSPPFDGEYMWHIAAAICTRPPPRASDRQPGLVGDFDRFFDRALARKPRDRFVNASELGEAFTAVASGQPMPAPLESAVTSESIAFDPSSSHGPPTRVASITKPSPGAPRGGDTTVRAVEMMTAGHSRGAWRRHLKSIIPIALGITIAAIGWFTRGNDTEDRAAAAPSATAEPQPPPPVVTTAEPTTPRAAAPVASAKTATAPTPKTPPTKRTPPAPSTAPSGTPAKKDNPFGI
ncbi:MAG TPA: serine/threonine-protein kinase, partial [Polyangiaceae bacterium]|nr:serine/threonine-protein kinase [Polyangiaceae bacterium]